tara:strand:- start:733 stop:939 length:207 start_codon:yes stop_codon:yes gene_type:complete
MMTPFYIVFKHDLKHPENKWRINRSPFEIWKEYDETFKHDSAGYEIMGYFDTRKEAQDFIKTNPVEAV